MQGLEAGVTVPPDLARSRYFSTEAATCDFEIGRSAGDSSLIAWQRRRENFKLKRCDQDKILL